MIDIDKIKKIIMQGKVGEVESLKDELNNDLHDDELLELMVLAANNSKAEVLQTFLTLDKLVSNPRDKTEFLLRLLSSDLSVNGPDTIAIALKGLEIKDKYQFEVGTIFLISAEQGFTEIVDYLLQIYSEDSEMYKYDALELAAKNGHINVVNKLLEERENPNYESQPASRLLSIRPIGVGLMESFSRQNDFKKLKRAFSFAAENGHIHVVDRLIEIDSLRDNLEYSVYKTLGLAAKNGHFDIFNRLLEFATNIPSIEEALYNQLYNSIEERNASNVANLLAISFLINYLESKEDNQDLLNAASSVDVVNRLLEVESISRCVANDNNLALVSAIIGGRSDIVMRLLQINEVVEALKVHSHLALSRATELGDDNIVSALLGIKEVADRAAYNNNAILENMRYHGQSVIIGRLLSVNSVLDKLDSLGYLSLECALLGGRIDLFNSLANNIGYLQDIMGQLNNINVVRRMRFIPLYIIVRKLAPENISQLGISNTTIKKLIVRKYKQAIDFKVKLKTVYKEFAMYNILPSGVDDAVVKFVYKVGADKSFIDADSQQKIFASYLKDQDPQFVCLLPEIIEEVKAEARVEEALEAKVETQEDSNKQGKPGNKFVAFIYGILNSFVFGVKSAFNYIVEKLLNKKHDSIDAKLKAEYAENIKSLKDLGENFNTLNGHECSDLAKTVLNSLLSRMEYLEKVLDKVIMLKDFSQTAAIRHEYDWLLSSCNEFINILQNGSDNKNVEIKVYADAYISHRQEINNDKLLCVVFEKLKESNDRSGAEQEENRDNALYADLVQKMKNL